MMGAGFGHLCACQLCHKRKKKRKIWHKALPRASPSEPLGLGKAGWHPDFSCRPVADDDVVMVQCVQCYSSSCLHTLGASWVLVLREVGLEPLTCDNTASIY